MEIRGCGGEYYDETLELINGVYAGAYGLPPRLQQRYPLLLGRANAQNMRIALEDGRPVSAFNFYEAAVLAGGASFRAASVGCVATGEGFRGRNYASLLMDDAEAKMRRDGVRLEIISGSRSLYTRKGACRAGSYLRYLVPARPAEKAAKAVEFEPRMLRELARIYTGESTRFYRSLDELGVLARANTADWPDRGRLLCIMGDGGMEAYALIAPERDGQEAAVRELGGDREALADALPGICLSMGMRQAALTFPRGDAMAGALQRRGLSGAAAEWSGTVKILDFEGLMADLLPYFRQLVPAEAMDGVSFRETDEGYEFRLGGGTALIRDIATLNKLVLGAEGDAAVESFLAHAPQPLRPFLETAFPIPFIWPDNMNYQ